MPYNNVIYLNNWTGTSRVFTNPTNTDWTLLLDWIRHLDGSHKPPSSLQQDTSYKYLYVLNWPAGQPPSAFTNLSFNPDWALFLDWIQSDNSDERPPQLLPSEPEPEPEPPLDISCNDVEKFLHRWWLWPSSGRPFPDDGDAPSTSGANFSLDPSSNSKNWRLYPFNSGGQACCGMTFPADASGEKGAFLQSNLNPNDASHNFEFTTDSLTISTKVYLGIDSSGVTTPPVKGGQHPISLEQQTRRRVIQFMARVLD